MKIYKFKDKYVVYLPFEVTKQLGLRGDEEVDFFKFSDTAFLFAKKEDITKLLMGTSKLETKTGVEVVSKTPTVSPEEINVLKKLDTLRYANRTAANVAKLLNESEKKILQGLMIRKVVFQFKNGPYSISKYVYDTFLMRKKMLVPQVAAKAVQAEKSAPARVEVVPVKVEKNENVQQLETSGYVVLPTEVEAANLSVVLEDSIRSGKVLGIRAFNKKFYIVLRAFFDKNNAKVIKELKEGPKSVDEMVKKTGIEEDAIRAILYLLSEQGDVSERRKDVFTLI